MRLILNPRLRRIVRALPQGGPLAWLEIVLLVALAFQLARLFWVAVTPVAPLGDWRPAAAATMPAAARDALFARFDAFYRTADTGGSSVVTSLSLKLFGVRLNEASGQGSAIIATPDGIQSSVAVGGEILAGVVLKEVALDHVVITRAGADEVLYLDQSTPAPVAAADAPPLSGMPSFNAPPPAPGAPSGAERLRSQIGFAPRVIDGKVSGLNVLPRGDGAAFRTAGLRSGDVIVGIEGRPVSSVGDLSALEARMRPGARISLTVERGAQTMPLAIVLPSQ